MADREPRSPHQQRRPGRPLRRHSAGTAATGRAGWSEPTASARRTDRVTLYGWHTVKAALENPQRKFHRLVMTENTARRLAESGAPLPLQPELVRPEAITALAGTEAVHQGLYAEAEPLASPELEDIPGGMLLVLDQITDPHNVGAILRSAAAFAVSAVVTTERHSPQASGVLAKAASGALEYVPIVTVGNLARALDRLKERDTLLVGLDSTGGTDLAEANLFSPMALIAGAEGKGMRRLTREHCDIIARLALPGRMQSLNVSNATAIALSIAAAKLAGA